MAFQLKTLPLRRNLMPRFVAAYIIGAVCS